MQYIQVKQYNSFTFELENCDGTPVDLSATTAKFIVKKSRNTPDEDAVLTGQIVNSDTNIIMFEFDATETDIVEGSYVMALKLFRDDDKNDEVWSDDVKVVKGVFNE